MNSDISLIISQLNNANNDIEDIKKITKEQVKKLDDDDRRKFEILLEKNKEQLEALYSNEKFLNIIYKELKYPKDNYQKVSIASVIIGILSAMALSFWLILSDNFISAFFSNLFIRNNFRHLFSLMILEDWILAVVGGVVGLLDGINVILAKKEKNNYKKYNLLAGLLISIVIGFIFYSTLSSSKWFLFILTSLVILTQLFIIVVTIFFPDKEKSKFIDFIKDYSHTYLIGISTFIAIFVFITIIYVNSLGFSSDDDFNIITYLSVLEDNKDCSFIEIADESEVQIITNYNISLKTKNYLQGYDVLLAISNSPKQYELKLGHVNKTGDFQFNEVIFEWYKSPLWNYIETIPYQITDPFPEINASLNYYEQISAVVEGNFSANQKVLLLFEIIDNERKMKERV
jgi:hypothetical protein